MLFFISATSLEFASADSFKLALSIKYIISPMWTWCFAKNSEVPKSIILGVGSVIFSLDKMISSTKFPFSYVFTAVILSFPRIPSCLIISSPFGKVGASL